MEQSKQEKVVELYKEKSNLCSDLSKLNDENYQFIIGYDTCMFIYGAITINSISKSFLAEIKKLTEEHIKQRIEEIDKELKEL